MDDTPPLTKEQRAALRHPEKAHRPDNPIQRKPDWIRVKAPTSAEYHETRTQVRKGDTQASPTPPQLKADQRD